MPRDCLLDIMGLPNGLEMSRPASPLLVSRQTQHLAGRVGSIELLGGLVGEHVGENVLNDSCCVFRDSQ